VRYAEAFAAALESLGEPSARHLDRAGLDEGVIRARGGYMSVSQLANFAAPAAERSGIWHLGLDAGTAPRLRHTRFSRRVLFAPTLLQSLRTLCSDGKSEDMTAVFHLDQRSELTWLCCGEVAGSHESVRQMELYRYGALLNQIRRAAGPDWLPPVLHLQSSDDGRLRDVPLVRNVNVRFGSRMLAIAIQPELLSRSMPVSDGVTVDDEGDTPTLPALGGEPSLEVRATAVVRTQLLARRPKLADTAGSLGISPRSLQRALAEYELTFSQLLEQTRIEEARRLLADTNEKLTDIATALGYRHSTHFARAFRRAHGISPRRYRSIQEH